jgi:hypothetical protein
MHRNLLASAIAALAVVAALSFSGPALAHHGGNGGHGWGGAPHFAGYHAFAGHRHFAFRRFHHRRFAFIVGPYGYGDGCYWLKRRAIYTGSPYLWQRYFACRNGYYY